MGGQGSGRKPEGTVEELGTVDELTELGYELTTPLDASEYPDSSKLTPDTHCRIVAMASKGATNLLIARASLIHPDTYQMWVKRAKDNPEQSPYITHLYEEVERVRAELAIRMSGRVIEAADSSLPNTWQAAATFLERRYPDDWSRNERRIIEGDDSRPQVNILVLNDPNARRAHQDLLGSIAGDSARPRESIGPGVRGELEAGEGRE